MRPLLSSRPVTVACVYLLLRQDRARFKLGWARDPVQRACVLPEFAQRELDLAASKAIWLPSRPRAEQVERSLHKALKPYRVEPGHRLDGCQEWFAGQAQEPALRLLGQMPLDDSSNDTARIAPLMQPAPTAEADRTDEASNSEPDSPEHSQREPDPQSLWWAIEDLLIRLAMACPVSVSGEGSGEPPVLTVHGLKASRHPRLMKLRGIALDAERWQCWHGDRPLSFVKTLGWEGDDLVLHFMPRHHIEGWDGGPELASQVQGFLMRLSHQARPERAA